MLNQHCHGHGILRLFASHAVLNISEPQFIIYKMGLVTLPNYWTT